MLPLQHDPSVGELQDFFHAHSTPLVGHYTYATKEKRYKDRRPLVLAFYTVDFGHDHKDGTFSIASKGTCTHIVEVDHLLGSHAVRTFY